MNEHFRIQTSIDIKYIDLYGLSREPQVSLASESLTQKITEVIFVNKKLSYKGHMADA